MTGFICFALRAPTDKISQRWLTVERSLPFIAIFLVVLLTLSYTNLLGFPTEMVTRAGVISGLVIAVWGFGILLARQHELAPQDYQRLRWVIWGCVIGLPALVFADAGTTTTLLDFFWPHYSPPEQLWGLLHLINGVLCLLVSEAVRKPYVVKVGIPLRRVTLLGLFLSVPILFLHHGIDHMRCLAVALYGPHATGNALSHEERSMLGELADKAASAFMQINDEQLRRRIAALERELATKAAELGRV